MNLTLNIEWPIQVHYPDGSCEDFIAICKRDLVGGLEYWPSEEWETEEVELRDALGRKLLGTIDIVLGICDLRIE